MQCQPGLASHGVEHRGHHDTDGAIEAVNAADEEFGLDRLLAEIERWRELPLRAGVDRIAAAVHGWSGGPVKDDISLLAIERTG